MVFCPNAHRKITVSQINSPLHRRAPATYDPAISKSMQERRGMAQRETHPPRVSADKRGPQPELDELVSKNKCLGHRHKTEPPEAAHLRCLCLFPATPPARNLQLTIGSERDPNSHTHTQQSEARGGWGPTDHCCLPITDCSLSLMLLLIGHQRKIS